MARPGKTVLVRSEFFQWRLFTREGVWYADGRGPGGAGGKHSLNTRDDQQAIERLNLLDRAKAIDVGRCTAMCVEAPTRITIAGGWQRFMQHAARPDVTGGTSEGTRKRYGAVRDKHQAFCRKAHVDYWDQVDRDHLLAYAEQLYRIVNGRRTKYAPRSIYLELTTLKSVQKQLIADRLVPSDLRINLSLRRPQGSDTYCYSPEQVRAMIRWCEGNSALGWMSVIIQMLALTGLRIGELASLRWSDLKLGHENEWAFIALTDERGSAKRLAAGSVRRTKGRYGRMIPVHPQLRALLGTLHRGHDGRLLHGPRGGRLKPDTVRNVFVRDVIGHLKSEFPTPKGEIGFEHGRLHSFRHFFVSQAFLQGATESEIKDWVGHKDSRMVEHYRHLADDESRRRMDQLDLLSGPAGADGPPQTVTAP